MRSLELLAPAKDKAVGIAAIDCGADAVYIAGPAWGNRKAAGNSIDDIRELCTYAHRFGVRIFLTVNTIIYDDEWDSVHSMMLEAQDAGVDAFIFREERLLSFPDITVPMHASTQCSIRSVERAQHFDRMGCARIILERGLSLQEVRAICDAVSCEVEFFVHGALCVCYSGECRLSEYLDGRSADRGECIQACRSLYDLVDSRGKVLVRNKALLSMRDFKLLDRLEDLAAAGVCSFKIEGRLKNSSYVKNVVREYSLALDELCRKHPDEYRRSSFGTVSGGFVPDSDRTFNRGYTSWWLDGKRDFWSAMDAANGEFVGELASVRPAGGGSLVLRLKPSGGKVPELANGDGFAFQGPSGAVLGFRADRCEGLQIWCKKVDGLRPGVRLYRNISTAFELAVDAAVMKREVRVDVEVRVSGAFVIELSARTEDGRTALSRFNADVERAENRERAEAMLREQLSKRSGEYLFSVKSVEASGALPLLSASTINSMRRLLAEDIPAWHAAPMGADNGAGNVSEVPGATAESSPLMRTRYCIRYELGLCPRYQKAAPTGPLYLLNNGRRLALGFDCARCEMTVSACD
ncbi:MAG: U32 family peptidase [Bacteroidales bacterium]|nr:U32 family peptidase [Bacteroidales bacterium]